MSVTVRIVDSKSATSGHSPAPQIEAWSVSTTQNVVDDRKSMRWAPLTRLGPKPMDGSPHSTLTNMGSTPPSPKLELKMAISFAAVGYLDDIGGQEIKPKAHKYCLAITSALNASPRARRKSLSGGWRRVFSMPAPTLSDRRRALTGHNGRRPGFRADRTGNRLQLPGFPAQVLRPERGKTRRNATNRANSTNSTVLLNQARDSRQSPADRIDLRD